ncbi:MAG: DUF1573 domain-containing protein [Candidatus Omnitrophica bacterium]|nr:DUF1573 domain-containing protein [Candidatus Omnitrophota bacterium]
MMAKPARGIGFILALVFLLPVTGCLAREVKNQKQVQQAEDPFSWDFGKIQQGSVAIHEFQLKNESGKTLKINDVTASCGCTVPKIKEKVLSPGQATAIEVKFNSKGYSGQVQQHIYVNTDNLDNPVIRFIIKADVIK